jgi:HD-GYP domain-containing protein (c-di-GMP phosphodiesterase class II)
VIGRRLTVTRAPSSPFPAGGEQVATAPATPASGVSGDELRLAELVAALSLGIDLGFDQPMEHVLRQTVIALRIADRIGMPDTQRATLYYSSLLVNVACHADAHEQAKWFGDDIELKAGKYRYDARSARGALAGLRSLGSGNPPLGRLRVAIAFAWGGHREVDAMIERHADLAGRFAGQLGLDVAVQHAVRASYERWDGRGWPGDLDGERIPLASRICQLAEYVEVAHRSGGSAEAARLARDRSGRQFDPALCTLVAAEADPLLAGLDGRRTWDRVIAAEPSLGPRLRGAALDGALGAVADFVDLKSPCTLGHSRAVAGLASDAAAMLGLDTATVTSVRRAALLHDVGRLGVSNAIWDYPGPLGAGERERIRLYPYLTERILSQSTALAPLAVLAVQHRERLDGSGYPRGLTAAAVGVPARTLAAADAYQTWREPRPHRREASADAAATRLREEARAGRLDADAVDAVLAVAGHRRERRHSRPAGLSPREIEVLRLIARGMSSKEIAARLNLSPKTVRNHTEHIYAKTGAGNRVAASLFAVEHGLLPAD